MKPSHSIDSDNVDNTASRGVWHNGVCPHDCPSACALQIERLSPTRIGKVRGAKNQPYTDGVICAKVSRYAERAHHPDRLLHPLRRISDKNAAPKFERIGWDDALELVCEKFTAAQAKHGGESVWPYYYGGTMGLVQRDGIIRLRNAMGWSGMKKTVCVQIAYDGWRAGAGAVRGVDAREMADSDLIVLWGCNAAATQINVMHHIARARKRGAKLVVIDPYENATAKVADLHLAPRPGSDGALACAMMHIMFKRNYADSDYLNNYAADAAQLERHLQSRDAHWAAQLTGLSVAQIESFAEMYGATRKSYIRLGIGFSRSRNGAVNVHAVSCLPTVGGKWQWRGGGALLATSDSFSVDHSLIQGLDDESDARTLDMSLIGAVLCGETRALRGGAKVAAMLIQNTNPMLIAPNLNKVRRGLLRDDLFVCVHEQFMTETAQLADVVLPATMFVEHDDLYLSYGHSFLQYGARVIEAPGECRSNHRLICELAARLGAQHQGFLLDEQQLIDRTLRASDYPPRESFTDQHFVDCAPPFDDAHFLRGFATPDKKFRFAPDWRALGEYAHDMPPLPDHWDVLDNADAEHPLRLVAAPSRGYLNGTFVQSPSSRAHEKSPHLKIHPHTAQQHQLPDGARVRIGNRRGAVTVTAKHAANIQADTVVVEGIHPAHAFPEGIGINVLMDDAPVAPAGGAAFHDTAVWVRACEE